MKNRKSMIGGEIAKILSSSLSKIRDTDYTEMTSVLSVEVTGDLKYAKVYLSIFSLDAVKRAKTFDAVKRASAFLKRELSVNLISRTVPSLTFVLDTSAEYSQKINNILDNIITPNEKK